jgi:hypothetical protein
MAKLGLTKVDFNLFALSWLRKKIRITYYIIRNIVFY